MYRFLKNITFFVLLIVTVLICYGCFCEWFFAQKKYYPTESKRMWVMKQENNVYDYAVLGSSRANGAFEILLLDSLTGLKGINIAANGSGYVDNYLILYQFLKNNNRVRYVFLQTDNYCFDPERNFSNPFHIYNFLPFWNDCEYKKVIEHYLDQTDRICFRILPVFRYYKYNKYYSPFQVISRYRNEDTAIGKPATTAPHSQITKRHQNKTLFGTAGTKSFQINEFDKEYLENIIDLCRKTKIEIFCFRAPDFYFQDSVFTNYQQCDYFLEQLLTSQKTIYLKPDESIRQNSGCFIDAGHLNDYGRFLNTVYFSKQINELLKN